jgi:acyl carrier protein
MPVILVDMKNLRLEIEERIKQILISGLDINPEIIAMSNPSTPLLGRGIGLDSMETLSLISAIEKEFDIEVADDDLTVDLFKNIGTLAEYILQKTK